MADDELDPRLIPALTQVCALLVACDYEELERRSLTQRVRAVDMKRVVDECGGELVMPANWDDVYTFKRAEEDSWLVELPTWRRETGRSDLEMSLRVTLCDGGTYTYEIFDLLVPRSLGLGYGRSQLFRDPTWMIIGDQSRFAVEFELHHEALSDPELADWQYGQVCWWCGGVQVGAYDPWTTLRDVAIQSADFLRGAGKRQDAELMSLSASQVVESILALRDDHGQSDEQVRLDEARFRRFRIGPAVSVFDPWFIVLVEDGETARLVWYLHDSRDVREQRLSVGEFESVLQEFLANLARATCAGGSPTSAG
jgi:hypothetical protein